MFTKITVWSGRSWLSLASKPPLVTSAMAAAGGLLGLGYLGAQTSVALTLNADDTNLLHTDTASRPKFKSATIQPSNDQSPGPPSIDAAPDQFSGATAPLRTS